MLIHCCRDVFTAPLRSNESALTTENTALQFLRAFASAGMCLPSRCLAINYSGFQASCHTIFVTELANIAVSQQQMPNPATEQDSVSSSYSQNLFSKYQLYSLRNASCCVILYINCRINYCQTQQLFGELLCLTRINTIMYISIVLLFPLSVLFFQLIHFLRSFPFQISTVSSSKLHVRSVVTFTLLRVTVRTQITKFVLLLQK
jgi:hypothetical protein